MGLFLDIVDKLFGREDEKVIRRPFNGFYPYGDKELDAIYNRMFCDVMKFHEQPDNNDFPQNIINSKELSEGDLVKVLKDESLPSTTKYLVCNIARKAGIEKIKGTFFGVVFEVRKEKGLQSFAFYDDNTAILIEETGEVFKYDGNGNASIDMALGRLIKHLKEQVRMVPDYQVRRLYPEPSDMRITELMSEGKYVKRLDGLGGIEFRFSNSYWDAVEQLMELMRGMPEHTAKGED